MKFARESWIIVAIGLADLIATLLFIGNHGAEEANALFRRLWQCGLPTFALARLACLLGPVVVLEGVRRRHPRFVLQASRLVIAAYLVLIGIGYARLKASGPDSIDSSAVVRVVSRETRRRLP